MKVLVIGKGGREHAICDKLSKSKYKPIIYVAPGNAGTSIYNNININDNDVNGLLEFALREKIDLTIVGPEDTLALGIVDIFRLNNLKIFGPTKNAARIETSKKFAKDLMKKYNIPTAKYESFNNYDDARMYVDKLGAPVVLKYDGLAYGKGVVVCESLDEAYYNLDLMLNKKIFGNDNVIIEEFLEGLEFSLLALVNNEKVSYLDPVQDHKRAYENNTGPNTGGMGTYSYVDFIKKEHLDESYNNILVPVTKALAKENSSFTGVLFAGLMLTKDGVKVIEFNCRFGDPETEVILPRIKNDFIDLINDVMEDRDINIEYINKYTLGVVMASKGYPGDYVKGKEIIINSDKLIYHMGTKFDNNNKLVNNGGRVLICVGFGDTLEEAKEDAYRIVSDVKSDNLFYRKDIGFQSLKK